MPEAGSNSWFQMIDETDLAGTIPYLAKAQVFSMLTAAKVSR